MTSTNTNLLLIIQGGLTNTILAGFRQIADTVKTLYDATRLDAPRVFKCKIASAKILDAAVT